MSFEPLPLAGQSAPREPAAETTPPSCHVVDGCLTCGDVAVPVTVVEAGWPDALCEDAHGQKGSVGVELVGDVVVGDSLLIHGGVAITRLDGPR